MRTKQPKDTARSRTWESAFPEDQSTEANRLRFLSRMGYISIAHYLLYRGLVPFGVYKRRRFEDIILYCFNSEESCRWGSKLSTMMGGMKQAIDRKYAESVFIMINEDKKNPDSATEVFKVCFCYNKDMAITVTDNNGQPIISMKYINEESFRHQAKQLINKLSVVTRELKKLGPDAVPHLKITYYPEVPDDYEPAGFRASNTTYVFNGPKKPVFYQYGHVSTDDTAVSIHLETIYINQEDIGDLEDAIEEKMQCLEEINQPGTELDMSVELGVQQHREEANAGIEMEVQRDDGHGDDNIGPLRIDTSVDEEIHADETMDKTPQRMDSNEEGLISPSPSPRRPAQRIITPRQDHIARARRLIQPKSSENVRAVVKSPEDVLVYENLNVQ